MSTKALKLNPSLESKFSKPRSDENHYEASFFIDGWVGLLHLDKVLSYAIEAGASDVHIVANQPISFTILGDIVKQTIFETPDHDTIQDLVESVLTRQSHGLYVSELDFDSSYIIKLGPHKGRRTRVNIGKSFESDFLIFRIINDKIPTFEELGINEEIENWIKESMGGFLICGPTGSGKALHNDTLVKTSYGYVPVSEVRLGDRLYDLEGKETRVLDIHGSLDKVHYEITFNGHEKIKASAGHLWFILEGDKWVVKTSEELYHEYVKTGEYLYSMPYLNEFWMTDIKELHDENPNDYLCFTVDSLTHSYLCGLSDIPTHNSTTLASLMRRVQITTKKKIITVEKPIEYLYPKDGEALIVQREVPRDCLNFANGLTSAMRQAPDIILIGEIRNAEEVSEFIRAAETGHAAWSTLHTNNVATTINRIASLFEGGEQRRIMSTLSDTLKGIANQTLLKTPDGKNRFAVREILTVNEYVRPMILSTDIAAIKDYMYQLEATMEHKIIEAALNEKCTWEEALEKAPDSELFYQILREKELIENN